MTNVCLTQYFTRVSLFLSTGNIFFKDYLHCLIIIILFSSYFNQLSKVQVGKPYTQTLHRKNRRNMSHFFLFFPFKSSPLGMKAFRTPVYGLKYFYLLFFWRARLCWPLLCLCRPNCSFYV